MEQLIQLLVAGLAAGCVYALIALSFELAYEATGVVNFATGQLVVVGALIGASAMAASGVPLAAFPAALGAMALVGLAFFVAGYWPLQRQPIVTIIIGTVAIGIFVQNVALLIWGALPVPATSPVGGATFRAAGAVIAHHAVFVIAATLALIGAVYVLIYRSFFGTQIRALAQDPETARLMGIRVNLVYAATWMLVAMLAGIAGVLLAPMWFVDVNLGDSLALKAFAAAVIGGFGSIPGAIVGGVMVGLTEVLSASYVSSKYKEAIVFALMVGFLLIRPQGLFGERIADRG